MTEFAGRSARVVFLDASNRLFLVRSASRRGQPDARVTPGGGVEDGEDLASAAARELQEETGLAVNAQDLHLVALTTGTAELGWASGLFRDDFFACRVVSHDVDTAGMTDFERGQYAGPHWWTLAELAATSGTIYLNDLADLVADLIAGRAPEMPVALPWHH